ncbi:ATP-binding protein [Cyclobacteriaceae bacterium]|nr:ATP-binding protein [Cyclobacteriaceae bacterium]
MFFNSRSIAFLIATLQVVITFLALNFLVELDKVELFVTLLISFLLTFSFCFLAFEWLFFQEFRTVYKVFERFQFSTNDFKQSVASSRKMSKDIISFAQSKQQEIQKLKQLETFRKEFLADISHELKTPIFSAQGFIHTLLDGAIDDPNVRDRFLSKAAKSLDQLDTLIQDLIIISQLETGKIKIEPENFDIIELVNEIFELLEPKRKLRNTTFTLECNETSLIVFADHNRINQVLKNLIDNAVKYGNDNGEVKVILSENAGKVNIQVADNGNGIAPEHADKIFRRFYRIEKSRSKEMGGTGLGLSIVKHIIEAHNENITVQSILDTGTTFKFDLQKA